MDVAVKEREGDGYDQALPGGECRRALEQGDEGRPKDSEPRLRTNQGIESIGVCIDWG